MRKLAAIEVGKCHWLTSLTFTLILLNGSESSMQDYIDDLLEDRLDDAFDDSDSDGELDECQFL